MKFGIVADDLTGACDCAVQMAARGYPAMVGVGPGVDPAGMEAIAVDTESRHLDEEEAAERVRLATAQLADAEILIKKIDSTLRGQIGMEVRAALAASGRDHAIVAPAFPLYGRTTVGGEVLVDGEPVATLPIARDPLAPVATSSVTELLALPTPAVGREELTAHGIAAALARSATIVTDIAEEEDFERLLDAVPDHRSVLWVGSTGLARAFGLRYARPEVEAPPAAPPARRVLVVVGSINEVARRQAERLLAAPGVALAEAGKPLPSEACLVLTSGEIDPSSDPHQVTEQLAAAAMAIVDEAGIEGIVATGGETAISLIERLGGSGIAVDREVEPGVPLGRVVGERPLPIVTKAGGFGTEDALVNAVAALTGDPTF